MLVSLSSFSGIRAARAKEAARFISSVIRLARASSAPRNRPGKASTLLIWLGWSLRPVPTMRAPAARASSGSISGTGLAMGKTTAPSAMEDTISLVTMCGALTPIRTSAPFIASASVPAIPSGLVRRAMSAWASFIGRPSRRMPARSTILRCLRPRLIRCFPMAMPAEPAPLITARTSPMSLPTTFRAFISAAATTMAVPCWSSWNTGMSHRSWSFRSISKQRGAAMSSKLMPPKEPEIRYTVRTNSSTSLVRTQRGKASTPPNSLNRAHLPSITGIPASGPMSPRPSTAVPSVITATRLCRRVRVKDWS